MTLSRIEALALLRAVEDLEREAVRNPLSAIAWLPGQIAWLSDPGPRPKLFRAGVRSGKSLAACQEVIGRATGRHPFQSKLRPPPVRIAFITSDKQAQGVQIMRLFWDLCPKDEIDPGTEFSSRTGFRGHVPVVKFKNGSEVVWYSNNAGPKTLQGSEYDYIQIDEPCSEEMFKEAENRVRNAGGQVGITLTPLHLPVPWLKEMCDEGLVTDHHYPLTVENQTSPLLGVPRTTKTGVPWDAAFIEDLRERHRGPDAGVRLDGDWEMRDTSQWFDCFHPDDHVSDQVAPGTMRLQLGIDYAKADRAAGMVGVLSASYRKLVDGVFKDFTHAIDEAAVAGSATMDEFAAALLAMLEARGIDWSELDVVWGDNAATSRHERASNTDLRVALLKLLPVRRLKPAIQSVKKGGGASHRNRRARDVRCRWAYNAMNHGRILIHPRCELLIKGLQTWDYTDKHPSKDVLDAWMYGLRELWENEEPQKVARLRLG